MKSERGAVIIEAVLSLTLFMFAMLTIFSIYNVCLAQARIGTALNATAEEISQYSYVYSLTGLNDAQSDVSSQGGAAESILSDNLTGLQGFFDAIHGFADTAGSFASNAGNTDSFLAYILNAGIDQLKGSACGEISRSLMRKHFGSDPDGYLEGLGVEGGMNGLSFVKTRFFTDGQNNEIFLNVRYQVTIIKLLNIDIKLNFEQCAKTLAWTA